MIYHPKLHASESESSSMKDYSETITGNLDCLGNTWVNGGLNHREGQTPLPEQSALDIALLICFLWQET